MKSSPVLLASAAFSVLALAACSTAPSGRELTLRHGRVILTPVAAAPVTEAATPAPTPAPSVVVSSTPVSLPEPVPVVPPPPPEPAPVPPPVPEPVVVAPPPPPPAPATPNFQALRTGSTVRLSWTLPENADGYRAIEVLRDSDPNPSGRGRIRAVRASVTQLDDTLPNPASDYWYWLKLTAPDGSVSNFGPFAATPAP